MKPTENGYKPAAAGGGGGAGAGGGGGASLMLDELKGDQLRLNECRPFVTEVLN